MNHPCSAENRSSPAGAQGGVPGTVMSEGCGNSTSNQAYESDFHGKCDSSVFSGKIGVES